MSWLPGNPYSVTFDSLAFDTADFPSFGLYDTSAWVFSMIPLGQDDPMMHEQDVTILQPCIDGLIRIRMLIPPSDLLSARVYSQEGRVLYHSRLSRGMYGSEYYLLQTGLTPGAYILLLSDGRWHGTWRIIML
jgi:hypothetical protein